MKKKRIVAGILTAAMVLSFAACGNKKDNEGKPKIEADAAYPLNTDETLTIWRGMGVGSARYATADEMPYIKELEKLTGVQVEFIHPPAGQGDERLKIMLASGDVADIISYDWTNYPGGADKVMKEGHIASLNELMDTYAKDFKEKIQKNPDIDRRAKTESGDYYTFPQIREDDSMNVPYGPVLRADWLEELGLPVPETLDDWYITLKAFKEKKGAEIPMVLAFLDLQSSGMFFGAYGVGASFYRDGNTVKYGPLEEGYRKTLEFLNKLYNEGLITDSITGVTSSERDSFILNGKSGASMGWLNSSVRAWKNNSAVQGTSFDLVGAKYPSLNKGENSALGYMMEPVVACDSISEASTKKELAAKFLNFNYTEKGEILANYGIEGQTYEMKDGKPVYTDMVFKNPDGLSLSQVLGIYASSGENGPYLYRKDAFMQINQEPELRAAVETWTKTDSADHRLSPMVIPEADLNEYSSILSDIDTYNSEMFYRFVMGVESFDKYDDYVAQLKNMNVDRLIEIQQKAYDSYMNR